MLCVITKNPPYTLGSRLNTEDNDETVQSKCKYVVSYKRLKTIYNSKTVSPKGGRSRSYEKYTLMLVRLKY